MDCSTALDILNGSVPASEEEWEAAALHLEACPECDEIFRRETEFDRQAAATMQAVAIPPRLKGNLLATLNLATDLAPADTDSQTVSPVVAPTGNSRPQGRFLRDRWLPLTLAGSVCAVVALALLLFQPPEPTRFSLTELTETGARLDWDQLPEFDGLAFSVADDPSLLSWKQAPGLAFSNVAHGWKPAGGQPLLNFRPEPHVMAIYRFEAPLRQGSTRSARGLLLAVPVNRLKVSDDEPLPAQDHFVKTNVRYLRTDDGLYASVAWVEGDLAYVCLVELPADAGDPLEQLLNVLYGPPV